MAKKKPGGKLTTLEVDLEALKIGLEGLEEVAEDLDEVRTNLRIYLDDTEKSLGFFPRKKKAELGYKPGARAKTGRR